MSYIISFGLSFLGLIKKNSKTLALLLIAVMWALYGWNTGVADYINYLWRFNGILDNTIEFNTEYGFSLFSSLVSSLGFDYTFFRIIYSLIGLTLISSTVFRYTYNVSFVFALYFIYPFLFDVAQMRNFMAMAIFTFAFRYLVEDKKYNTLKYVICISIACTFHTAAIFYFIFIFAKYVRKNILSIITLISVPIGCLLSYTGLILNIVSKFTAREKIIHWFDNRAKLGILLMWGLLLLNVAIVHLVCNKIVVSDYSNYSQEQMDYKSRCVDPKIVGNFSEVLIKINILTLFVMVLLIFNQEFVRIYRNLLPLYYISLAIYQQQKTTNIKEKYLFLLLNIGYVFFLAIYYIYTTNALYTVFMGVFENNQLF